MSQTFSYTRPYEEAHVTADLSAKAMMMIAMLCDQVEQNKSYGELIQTKDVLSKFGFSNSQSAKLLGGMTPQMQQYTEATNALAFMEEVWEKFGKDAMVVRYDHFFEILEKYDMVCGSFDRYTGAIPQEAIDTLERLAEMWGQKALAKKYAESFEYIGSYSFTNEFSDIEHLKRNCRLPFIVERKDLDDLIGQNTKSHTRKFEPLKRDSLSDALFIAAPAADMKPLEIEVEFKTAKLKELREVNPRTEILPLNWVVPFERISKKEAEWREAEWHRVNAIRDKELREIRQAVTDEENRLKEIFRTSDINRYAKIDFISEEPKIVRILRDPFICSLTPYGVLIHAKWGAEAEDATIKRYEQLREAVMGKGV